MKKKRVRKIERLKLPKLTKEIAEQIDANYQKFLEEENAKKLMR